MRKDDSIKQYGMYIGIGGTAERFNMEEERGAIRAGARREGLSQSVFLNALPSVIYLMSKESH